MTRYAVVTGGTGDLGRAVARRFLEAGYHVTLADVSPEDLALLAELRSGLPGSLEYVQANLLLAQEREALVKRLDSVDVLVNLVGGFAFESFAETSAEGLERMLDLNLRSTFYMSQALLPLLRQSPQGRIVNVGARQALQGGALVSAYALSKAAVVNLTQSLAQELLNSEITVNAVLPSIIDTPANRDSLPDADFESWVSPQDLAEVIFFLASPVARAVSGALIPVYHKA